MDSTALAVLNTTLLSASGFTTVESGTLPTTPFTTQTVSQTPGDEGGISPLNGVRIFVCTVGVLGNVAVILMILILSEFKKGITSWYILQLAIADTIFLLTLPFKVVESERGSWVFPEWMCKASQSILFINYYCSVTFLTIMAIDRYIAICHSFSERLQKLRSHRVAYVTTAIVWVVAVAICTPVMIHSSVRGTKPGCTCQLQFPKPKKSITEICIEYGLGDDIARCRTIIATLPTTKACADPSGASAASSSSVGGTSGDTLDMNCNYLGHPAGYRALLYFNFIVMFIIPFVIIAVCYTLIIHHLMATSFKSDSNAKSKAASKDRHNRNRVVIMCATLVAVFGVCWLPYHSVHMAKMRGIPGLGTFCIRLSSATTVLIYVNSAVNPFIYFIVARFKTQFARMRKSRAASAVLAFFTRQTHVDSSSGATSRSGQTNQAMQRDASEDSRVHETTSHL